MKIAAAAYPMDVLPDWTAYASKIGAWVAEAAGQGADLLVFPEYGAMELATLAGLEVAGDLEASLRAVSDRIPDADALHARLAAEHGVHILAASAPVFDPAFGARPVNRARLFAPSGAVGVQDKQIMTRFEREVWGVVPGGPLRLFDTALGTLAVLICYDSEYPLLGRAVAGADMLLVPSCTEALSGYWRVRIGAMARALEAQCVTVMSSTVGDAPWSEAVDTNCGAGGVYGPPDRGFPPTGVIAAGTVDAPGWTYAEVDPAAIAAVRADGVVLNRQHWDDQHGRDGFPERVSLG
ncbi:carbon-nitrogen hydrolase family protein [Roseivivax isoporae]|uniref:Amidohydrolase n=1 Tax=Roseivivax isoporae LMG 25204 TaxID=1449351 RepID=X7F2J8_9RHOB|nr:carbon-nitrogen hydrolase family protein [Roseivivax isoporae]ETX27127.1 amidohydrolase [Roseivivax isoporae LMG 25204]